ncbi:MAG: DNA repair protein RadC [Deferribacteraceae bacterium]|jgi:DNA repair protein RadC|nr:DNA repair protein RadC [Deferribacteraceae bacterium]
MSAQPTYFEHRKRLKERFAVSPEAVADTELLELLLGYVIKRRDVKPQARDILKRAEHLGNIFDCDLAAVKGVGSETETFFELLKEFVTRSSYRKIEKKTLNLSDQGEVYAYLRNRIAAASQEMLAILFLDARNRLIANKVLKQGKVGDISFDIRDIIVSALEKSAYGVILAHNHPTGEIQPTHADIASTREVFKALRYAGVELVDHLIVATNGYYSMRGEGVLQKIAAEAR